MEFLQYSTYLFLVFVQLFHVIGGQSVGTPTNATVCDGRTTTLTCDISQSGGSTPVWRVFTTSDTGGSPVATLISGQNSPPYNYPAVQAGDTVARLEVNANSSIDGYHFQCGLSLVPPVDSPGTGTITVTDTPSCPTSCTRSRNEDFTTVSVSCQQPPNTLPVTSTTVTYCPTSSPNCGNSMNCTTSPCNISGLNACEDYQLRVVPANNCGGPTECTGNSVMSDGQDTPSCPTSCTESRNEDFTTVSVSCQQPSNTPPVTSTTVTYCPTSSPNCGDSMNCTTSPCNISGLNACEDYQLTVVPNNNCGGPTECTGNSVMTEGQDMPSCPTDVQVQNVDSINCFVSLTWQQPPTTPPVTSTTVTYCPTSSPNCGNSMTCTSPCNISGLDPGTDYQFRLIPNNNCGSRTGCTGNMTRTPDSCMPTVTSTTPTPPPNVGAIAGGVIVGLSGLTIGALATYAIAVLIVVLCCTSCEGRSYCQVFFCQYCCGGETKRPNSTRPMSADEYTDFKKVEEEKEKEDKITYAALEFSEKPGSSGENTIRSKEEPVQYLVVGQA